MQPAVTVVTCAHNPRTEYLRRVIEALRAQTASTDKWEYLLIDNRSKVPLSSRIDLSWHPAARHIVEEALGLTYARLRGIKEARGDIVVFVDDDNVVASDFIEVAIDVGTTHPNLGAWGGIVEPEFEAEPPPWALRYLGALAIRRFAGDQWSNVPWLQETMPCGAGMCVRAAVAQRYATLHQTRRSVILDRTGESLLSGGDNDLALCSFDLGWGCGMFTRLKLQHLIPKERLSKAYLLRLLENIAYSSEVLYSLRPETRSGNGSSRLRDLYVFCRSMCRSSFDREVFLACRRGRASALRTLAAGAPSLAR